MTKVTYDANHFDRKKDYEDLGCSTLDLAALGCVVDLAVGCVGISAIVEVKNETDGGKLTPAQETFVARWRGEFRIVRTREDVIAHVQDMRTKARLLVRPRMQGPERSDG